MKSTIFAGLSLAVLLAITPAVAADKAPKADAAATTAPAATKQAATKPAAAKTEADNKNWAGLPVENKKGEQLGTVVEAVPATGKVKEVHVKVGEDVVKAAAKKMKKEATKVVTSLTADQLKKLPKVKK